jgi:threonine/homoserine/homoserine lactone efflux protein
MTYVQGIFLFLLGVGAAFLAYFAYKKITGDLSAIRATPATASIPSRLKVA